MAAQPLSLREVARQAGISPAYLSRMLNGERGLPADDKLLISLERILDIQPQGALFDAAERPDSLTKHFLKTPDARVLMRSLRPLTEEERTKVIDYAKTLAERRDNSKP